MSANAAAVPAALLASQPPPSAFLPAASLASLFSLLPSGTPVAFQVVQYGYSPANETAGLGGLSYAPPTPVSDAAISGASTAAAAVVAAARGTRAGTLLQRALQAVTASITSALNVAVAAQGGTTASGASQASLLATAPRAQAAQDLLPGRPMDSRTVVPSALLPGGVSAGALVLATPFQLVIPLRDLSIVQWNAATGTAVGGVNVGQASINAGTRAFNITCPASPAAAAVGITAVSLPSRAPAAVRLVSATRVGYTSVVGTSVEVAAGAGGGIAGASSASKDQLSAGGGLGASVQAAASFSYVLSVECGAVFGVRTLACGVGMEGTVVTYVCPQAQPVPQCLWYDASTGAWSASGTAVASIAPTAITCNATHLAPHAVRFSLLPAVQADIFATAAPITVSSVITYSPASFVLMALLTVALALLAYTAGSGRAASRFSAALVAQEPWLGAAAAAGRLDVLAARRGGASVAPEPLALAASGGGGVAAGASSSDPVLAELLARVRHICSPGVGSAAAAVQAWRAARGAAPSEKEAVHDLAALLRSVFLHRLSTHLPVLLAPLSWQWGYFHPHLPSAASGTTRFLAALASGLTGLLGAVILYVSLLGSTAAPGTLVLPGLTPPQFIALALACALFFALPVDVAVGVAVRHGLGVRANARYPVLLGAEAAQRKAFCDALEGMPTAALLELVGGSVMQLLSVEEVQALAAAEGSSATTTSGALTMQQVMAAVEAAGRDASEGNPPTTSMSLTLLPLNLALLALIGFSSFYLYAFAMVRGAEATSQAVGSWVLAVGVHCAVLHPLALLARMRLALLMHERWVEDRGGQLRGVASAAVSLALRTHLLPAAAAAAALGARSSVASAVAVLAPVEELLACWQAGKDPHVQLRAALLHCVYAAATRARSPAAVGAADALAKQGTGGEEGAAAAQHTDVSQPGGPATTLSSAASKRSGWEGSSFSSSSSSSSSSGDPLSLARVPATPRGQAVEGISVGLHAARAVWQARAVFAGSEAAAGAGGGPQPPRGAPPWASLPRGGPRLLGGPRPALPLRGGAALQGAGLAALGGRGPPRGVLIGGGNGGAAGPPRAQW